MVSSSAPLRGLAPLAGLLAVWQVLGSPDSPYFPAPLSWVSALVSLWGSGALLSGVFATLQTFAIGLSAATVLGALLGLIVGAARPADRALNPTFEFARATPPAVMVPIATLLLGYDETMKVTVVILAAIWPVLLNTRAGIRGLNTTLLDTASTLRLSRVDRLRKVVFPALLPSVLLGVRVAAPIGVAITLLVEILTQVDGVGALIANAQRTFQPPQVYGLIVVAGLISLLINALLGLLEARVFRYRAG